PPEPQMARQPLNVVTEQPLTLLHGPASLLKERRRLSISGPPESTVACCRLQARPVPTMVPPTRTTEIHGIQQPARVRRRPGEERPPPPHRRRDRPVSGDGRDPPPRLSGRRAGAALHAPEGLRLSDGQQLVRHHRTHPLPLPRYARCRPPRRRVE